MARLDISSFQTETENETENAPVGFGIMRFTNTLYVCAFSALTLLVGRQEEHPARKN